jgi:hypothetical protein
VPLLFAAMVASMTEMGWVGEVIGDWALTDPPAVLVEATGTYADPSRTPNAGHRWGDRVSLDAAQVRPIESIQIGGDQTVARLPLMVNSYTGALPDWPSRAIFDVTGSLRAALALHLIAALAIAGGLGAGLRRHGAGVAGGAAAIWLVTDWNFAWYRTVLGGTELALLAASGLLMFAFVDRRWRGAASAPWLVALGIGLGLHAKITFVAPLLAAATATVATRWDRGGLQPPPPVSNRTIVMGIGLIAALLTPAAISMLHTRFLPDDLHIHSHDFADLQWRRLFTGWTRASFGREQPVNLYCWWLDPLAFFRRGCDEAPGVSIGRAMGLAILIFGTFLSWRDRTPREPDALLRWLSIATPLASIGLFALNRDVHHQSQLTMWLAAWGGLAIDRVAATISPPRTITRAACAALLCAPWAVAGLLDATATDATLRRCVPPSVRSSGQQAVVQLLRRHQVDRLMVCDYDLYGALDALAPEVTITNGWGAMSWSNDRDQTLIDLLHSGAGGWYLAVEPSARRIYEYDPGDERIRRLGRDAGVKVEPVESVSDPVAGQWARLFRLWPRPRPGG